MNKQQLIEAFKAEDFAPYIVRAMELRQQYHGNKVYLRAIIEYSNYCKRNCQYCGLYRGNNVLDRYRMTEEEILRTAQEAFEAGYLTAVVQGGEDVYYNTDRLCRISKRISIMGMTVTLSSGELDDLAYVELRNNGATRYLLKHETANASLYGKLHPDSDLNTRLSHIRALKRVGYDTGSGFMVGLPGQTIEDLADDLLLLKDLDVDMAGIGTFIPQSHTPLADCLPGSAELTLRAICLLRILMPHINIPATTSLGVAAKDPYIALNYGADVIMRKVTPTEYRKLYKIYDMESRSTDVQKERDEIVANVAKRGFCAI